MRAGRPMGGGHGGGWRGGCPEGRDRRALPQDGGTTSVIGSCCVNGGCGVPKTSSGCPSWQSCPGLRSWEAASIPRPLRVCPLRVTPLWGRGCCGGLSQAKRGTGQLGGPSWSRILPQHRDVGPRAEVAREPAAWAGSTCTCLYRCGGISLRGGRRHVRERGRSCPRTSTRDANSGGDQHRQSHVAGEPRWALGLAAWRGEVRKGMRLSGHIPKFLCMWH